ncbi:MAG: hypothetical protein EBU75_05375 [Betaproteobacteria bacterium]|nr:hypothetical protein [Betaproteobacteria bacterium]NDD11190.1 hypothetical protein [Betaproteobacteria bacterium]
MRTIYRLFLVVFAFALAGCLETMPKVGSFDDIPYAPTLKDRNATIAQAWDKASLDCRSQNKPRGSFCEQLKIEGEFLSCSADRFAKAAQALRYPAPDKMWVWHNCVQTTANLLRDGFYLSKRDIEKRMSECQAKFDPEPEFPVRQSGWLAPLVAMITTNDKEPIQAVLPGDFALNQSQVALPNCLARFAPLAQPLAEVKPVPVVAAPVQEAVVPVVTPTEPMETSKTSRQTVKPKPRNTVSTADVKSTATGNLARSAPSSAANQSPEVKGGCPIPGACGPSVPPDAVKRP